MVRLILHQLADFDSDCAQTIVVTIPALSVMKRAARFLLAQAAFLRTHSTTSIVFLQCSIRSKCLQRLKRQRGLHQRQPKAKALVSRNSQLLPSTLGF